jgi:hypothetical protein
MRITRYVVTAPTIWNTKHNILRFIIILIAVVVVIIIIIILIPKHFRISGLENFLFITVSRSVLGSTQPPIQWVPGTLSPEVSRPGREADHSPPSRADVKNA